MTPLDVFVARWNAVAMPLPIFPVVNILVDLDGKPDAWAGALDQGDARGDVTLGSNPWLETHGQIFVALIAKSGTGDAVLAAAVDAMRDHFQGYRLPDDALRFPTVIGPEDNNPEGNGVWWQLTMRVPYVLQARRAEPLVP
jgi:hypothetical protein